MPCAIHFTDGSTLVSDLTAHEFHDAWKSGGGSPIHAPRRVDAGAWVNPAAVVRFEDVDETTAPRETSG